VSDHRCFERGSPRCQVMTRKQLGVIRIEAYRSHGESLGALLPRLAGESQAVRDEQAVQVRGLRRLRQVSHC